MKPGRYLCALALLALAAPAFANDLCFDDDLGGGSIYIFKKVKLPKQPLDAAPVAGTRLGQTGVSGIVFRTDSGQLRLSVTTADGCFVTVSFDDALDGEAFYNCLGGVTDTSSWTPRDCSSIVF